MEQIVIRANCQAKKLKILCKNRNTQLFDLWNVIDDIGQTFFNALVSTLGSFAYIQTSYIHGDIIYKGCY